MPKRPKTPPPTEDEPKLLTVIHPYPMYANMKQPEDRIQFSRWIVSAIDGKDFMNFYWLPSANSNTVLIAVKRDCKTINNILGEHRWGEILKASSNPDVSKVYYCKHPSIRDATKVGWKEVHIDPDWFKGWKPEDSVFRYPYPKSHWCDIPSTDDKTNKDLCRPLPKDDFPPPPPPPRAVPGSEGWSTLRGATPAGRGRGGAPANASNSRRKKNTAAPPQMQPPAPPGNVTAASSGSNRVSPHSSAGNSPSVTPAPSSSTRQPDAPPGLGPPNVWKQVPRVNVTASPPGLPQLSANYSSSSSGSPIDPESPEMQYTVAASPSIERQFTQLTVGNPGRVPGYAADARGEGRGETYAYDDGYEFQGWVPDPVETDPETPQYKWSDPNKVDALKEPGCEKHFDRIKPKICHDCGKLKREREKAQQAASKNTVAQKKVNDNKLNMRGGNKAWDRGGDASPTKQLPMTGANTVTSTQPGRAWGQLQGATALTARISATPRTIPAKAIPAVVATSSAGTAPIDANDSAVPVKRGWGSGKMNYRARVNSTVTAVPAAAATSNLASSVSDAPADTVDTAFPVKRGGGSGKMNLQSKTAAKKAEPKPALATDVDSSDPWNQRGTNDPWGAGDSSTDWFTAAEAEHHPRGRRDSISTATGSDAWGTVDDLPT